MALFNFGKKKEEEKKTPACACSCGGAASEAESITNDCCPDSVSYTHLYSAHGFFGCELYVALLYRQ